METILLGNECAGMKMAIRGKCVIKHKQTFMLHAAFHMETTETTIMLAVDGCRCFITVIALRFRVSFHQSTNIFNQKSFDAFIVRTVLR